MKMVVFGASGGCGAHLVDQAVRRGHEVTAVVRPSSTWAAPEGVRRVAGDVLSEDFLRQTVAGQDAVLSGLGLRRASPAPWSKLLSPPDLVQRFTAGLRRAVDDSEVARIVWISAGGVGDSAERLSSLVRTLTRSGNVGVAYQDLESAEEAMPTDDGRWLAVRPVTLVGGAFTGRAGPVERYGLLSTIRRADVAGWMVEVAEGSRECRARAVLLGTKG